MEQNKISTSEIDDDLVSYDPQLIGNLGIIRYYIQNDNKLSKLIDQGDKWNVDGTNIYLDKKLVYLFLSSFKKKKKINIFTQLSNDLYSDILIKLMRKDLYNFLLLDYDRINQNNYFWKRKFIEEYGNMVTLGISVVSSSIIYLLSLFIFRALPLKEVVQYIFKK